MLSHFTRQFATLSSKNRIVDGYDCNYLFYSFFISIDLQKKLEKALSFDFSSSLLIQKIKEVILIYAESRIVSICIIHNFITLICKCYCL